MVTLLIALVFGVLTILSVLALDLGLTHTVASDALTSATDKLHVTDSCSGIICIIITPVNAIAKIVTTAYDVAASFLSIITFNVGIPTPIASIIFAITGFMFLYTLLRLIRGNE